MNLEELNQIDNERRAAESRARAYKEHEKNLAVCRNGDKELVELIYHANKESQYGAGYEMRSKVLNAAVNRFKIEILRIAELEFEALAREQTSRALMLKAQLNAYLPEPATEAQ